MTVSLQKGRKKFIQVEKMSKKSFSFTFSRSIFWLAINSYLFISRMLPLLLIVDNEKGSHKIYFLIKILKVCIVHPSLFSPLD